MTQIDHLVSDDDYVTSPVFYIAMREDPLRQQVERIERVFGLTPVELANALKASIDSIRAWSNQVEAPSPKQQQRLFHVDLLVGDWVDAGLPQERNELTRPIIDGKSVIDLLCEDRLDRNLVLFAGSRLRLNQLGSRLRDPFNSESLS